MKEGFLCPFFDGNAKGIQQFSEQGSRKSASLPFVLTYIYTHTYRCSFLAFCFGASLTLEDIVVYFLPRIHKLSLLFSPFIFKKKKEESKKELQQIQCFCIVLSANHQKHPLDMFFLNSFAFQCLFLCHICFLELPIDMMRNEIF
jgi:hypothetical protein